MSNDLDMDIKGEDGRVVFKFSKPIDIVVMSIPDAQQVAEHIAREAHAELYHRAAPEKQNLITEQIRNRCITRVTHVIRNLQGKNKLPAYVATQVVDTILAEVL